MRTLRKPCSAARRASSRHATTCSCPCAAGATTAPAGARAMAETPQPAFGRANRLISTRASPPSRPSRRAPRPCAGRRRSPGRRGGRGRRGARLPRAPRRGTRGPSVLGISTRYCAPSGNRFSEVGSSCRSPGGSPAFEELPRRRHGITLKGERAIADHGLWPLSSSPTCAARRRCASRCAAGRGARLAGWRCSLEASRARCSSSTGACASPRRSDRGVLRWASIRSARRSRGVPARRRHGLRARLSRGARRRRDAARAAVADRDWLVTVSPLGERTGIVVAIDVTDHKRRERRLTELATRDALTGPWNRRLVEELDWLARSGGPAALLVLDLDGFKQVNDRSATTQATSCSAAWRRRCTAAYGARTSWRGSAATSSRCC